jgi:putative transposase
MARLPRLVVAGQVHHVLLRGHNAQPVFIDDEDLRHYLDALQEAAHVHGVQVHAYALLDREVQLLLRPGAAAGLSRTMQAVGRRYGAHFNRRHGRSGTLWEGRFRAGVVQAGLCVLQCLVLIDGLPARHGLAVSPHESRWSSAPHRLGLRRDPLVTDPSEYWRLGNTPFEREAAYAALLAQGLAPDVVQRIEHTAANGWALGTAQFLAEMAAQLGRAVRPRSPGRPRRAG